MIKNAEDFENSATLEAIKKQSLAFNMYTVATISRFTKENKEKYYNTAFVINPKGELQTTMNKIHLFDIDIPGIKVTTQEK